MNALKIPTQTFILVALLNVIGAIVAGSHTPRPLQHAIALLAPWHFLLVGVTLVLAVHRERLLLLAWLGVVLLWSWDTTGPNQWVTLLIPVAAAVGMAELIHHEHHLSPPSSTNHASPLEVEYVDEQSDRRPRQPVPGGRSGRVRYVAPPGAPRGTPGRGQESGWYDQHD